MDEVYIKKFILTELKKFNFKHFIRRFYRLRIFAT